MDKKGMEMSLQFVFLIFLGTISVMIIVGLLTSWSFDVNRYMKSWLKTSSGDQISDIQRINYTSCDSMNMNNEVVKHAKLCYTKGKQGLVINQLCYALIMPGCSIDPDTISNTLSSSGVDYSISVPAPDGVDKIIISYDYQNYRVLID